MRRITVSCPGCRNEFKTIPIDEAERLLFYGCEGCRKMNPSFRFRGVRNPARSLSQTPE